MIHSSIYFNGLHKYFKTAKVLMNTFSSKGSYMEEPDGESWPAIFYHESGRDQPHMTEVMKWPSGKAATYLLLMQCNDADESEEASIKLTHSMSDTSKTIF